ncbi:hypothetical protein [[Erwinia] mediterraneensis]|nr:hypothetical protein [[Erwinia] mediterraneensis]
MEKAIFPEVKPELALTKEQEKRATARYKRACGPRAWDENANMHANSERE